MNIPAHVVQASLQATILKRKIAALTKDLDEKKAVIRTWANDAYPLARKADPECTMLEVPTREGTLSVIFPSDKPEVKEGAELETLAKELLPVKSQLVVAQEWRMVKEFKENWLAEPTLFSKQERKIIEKVIFWKPQTCRIEPAK